MPSPLSAERFYALLKRYYGWYIVGVVGFVVLMGVLEQFGLSQSAIGYTFLFAVLAVCAVIGVMSRTSDVTEYFVAGRRIPPLFNGLATAADWLSAASFIGLAGTLYFSGYEGLAFILGWTGGYCLVALLLAPYLRKFGQFTIPDFLGARYGGHLPRVIGLVLAIACSFTYLVAQIYGVGLITSRFTGLEFGIGVFVGLAGVLFCSFLGGMRTITWTQAAQYVILLLAYLLPVVWLSAKHTDNPIPHISYGQTLQLLGEREKQLNDAHTVDGSREAAVRLKLMQQAHVMDSKLASLTQDGGQGGMAFLDKERKLLAQRVQQEKQAANPDRELIRQAEISLRAFPADPVKARDQWLRERDAALLHAQPIKPHAQPFAANTAAESATMRNNFLALVFCLIVGTAALPHVLTRSYTTTSVQAARESVSWSLLFIILFYLTVPALAVFIKYEVYNHLVGSSFSSLPDWVNSWAAVDKSLISVKDINGDGIVQLAEISIDGDMLVLATPEIAGLPFVVTALVAAGGLAAALSTADGLLLVLSAALSHDLYYKIASPSIQAPRRLVASKAILLLIAFVAAYVTSVKPGNILFLVGAAFSIAASAFFPALVSGIFWKRANQTGAVLGMLLGVSVCAFYMVQTYEFFGINAAKWWGINPIAAGVFGVPAGFIGLILGSLLTPRPGAEPERMVEFVRYPEQEEA